MEPKRVYVCFDWSRDAACRDSLASWSEGTEWEFVFCDAMNEEFSADRMEDVKGRVRDAIQGARYTLVLVGEGANQRDRNSRALGFRNWMNWEIEESISNRNRICAVKLDWQNTSPDTLANTHATWAQRFEAEFIFKALTDA